jgi:hypothetical protein
MANPTQKQMKRVALPMVQCDDDWQLILETVKDEFNMDATEENRELIMDVIRECEDEVAEVAWNAMPPHS